MEPKGQEGGMQVKLNATKNQEVRVGCRECKRETKHLILASIDTSGSDDHSEIFWESNYQIMQCQGCETFSFRRASTSSEDSIFDRYGNESLRVQEEIYPNPSAGREALAETYLLPQEIRHIYEETIQSINSNQPVLCGIGIRAIIESITKEKNSAPGENLQKKIDGLVGMGVLTLEGSEILHKLRVLGNVAAHEVKPHSKEQLGLALTVVEHLMQGVYILPKHANDTFD
jgi:hypothetical protein